MPQELSFGVSLPTASADSFALGSQRIFCPFSLVLRAAVSHMSVVMSCVSLRLNSRCWLRSRTPSRLASPGLWALLVLVAPLLLPMLVHPQLPLLPQRPQPLRWCLRPVTRWQPPCCAPRLSGLHPLEPALAHVLLRRCPNVHRVAVPASPLACVDRLLSLSRDWLRAWPPRVAHKAAKRSMWREI